MKLNRHVYTHSLEKKHGLWELRNKTGNLICEPVKLKQVGNDKLSKLAYSPNVIDRNEGGDIIRVELYEKDMDTVSTEYLDRLKMLGNLTVNQL